LLLAAPLFAYLVYPLLSMLLESLDRPVLPYRAREMGWDAAHQPAAAGLRYALRDSRTFQALCGTVKISLLSTLCAGAWGCALALLWWRREFPGRRWFAALGYAPLLMPPLVGTIAFFRLMGGAGGGPGWLSGFNQVLTLHTYAFGLYTYAYVAAALQTADFATEDAARSLGAGGLRVFRVSVWPVMRAPLLASALLTLMASAASYSGPAILDNSARYLTVQIVNEQGDLGLQRALSTILAALALAALPAFLLVNGKGSAGDVTRALKGSARKTLPPARKPEAVARLVLSCLAAVLLLAPPAMVVISALAPEVLSSAKGARDLGFLSAFAALGSSEIKALGRSALYGAVAAAINVLLALVVALTLRRASFAAALPVEFAVMLALAVPGSAVAIALLSAFNAPSALTFGAPLGGTATMLVLAYVIRDLPLAARPARAALQSLGGDLEQAAAGLGATGARVLWRVTLPLILPSLLAAFLLCFVAGAGEFVASRLLASPLTLPASVRIDDIYRTDPHAAYALTLCLMLMTAAAVGLAAWVQKKLERS
jgi:iron(III) transport system permease protein